MSDSSTKTSAQEHDPDAWLDSLGLLRTGRRDRRTVVLPEDVQHLLLSSLLTGGTLPRKLALKQSADTLLLAEAHGVAYWETDSKGKPAVFSLTWKGRDLAQLLLKQARAAQGLPAAQPIHSRSA